VSFINEQFRIFFSKHIVDYIQADLLTPSLDVKKINRCIIAKNNDD
jgi:hypothetical protein